MDNRKEFMAFTCNLLSENTGQEIAPVSAKQQ